MKISIARAASGVALGAALLGLFLAFPAGQPTPLPIDAYDAGTSHLSLTEAMALPPAAWQRVDARQLSYPAATGREVWLHMAIPAGALNEPWVAEIATPNIRQIDLSLTEGATVKETALLGMDRPFDPARSSQFHSHRFTTPGTNQRDLYIRAYTQGTAYLPLHVYSEHEFAGKMMQRSATLWICFGVYAGIVVYNLLIFLSLRDRIYFYYCGYQMTILVLGSTIMGASQLLNPYMATHFDFTMRFMCIMLLLTCGLCSLFIQRFTATKQNDPAIDPYFMPYNVLVACATLAAFVLPINLMVNLTLGITMVSSFIVAILASMRSRMIKEYILFFGFTGMGACEALHLATTNGLLATSMFSEFIVGLGGSWEALFFSLALAHRITSLQAERRQIIDTLKGEAPASQLNALLNESYSKSHGLNEMNMTIMFIDIVGFSQISEILGSHLVFQHLSKLMQEITNIIEECHGTVDRSLGDGVLCFVGYDSGMRFHHHAQDAFQAACKIQASIVGAFTEVHPAGDFVLPVRIGLHVADVLIGDLGGRRRIDFTMIGSGVNFASRLESACSPFKIMISEECHSHLTSAQREDLGFSEIYVAIKHQEMLVKAYEFNPFAAVPNTLEVVERLHLDQLQLQPRDSRYVLADGQQLHLNSLYGNFRVLDFSSHGFRVISDTYIGRKVTMLVEVATYAEVMNQALKQTLLRSFYVEVRWSRKVAAGYEHGLKIFGLNTEQREKIFAQLEALFQLQDRQRGVEDEKIVA